MGSSRVKDFQGEEMHDAQGFLIRDRVKPYTDDCSDTMLDSDYDYSPGVEEVELEGSECDLCGWNSEYLRYRKRPDNDYDVYFRVGCYNAFNDIMTQEELDEYIAAYGMEANSD